MKFLKTLIYKYFVFLKCAQFLLALFIILVGLRMTWYVYVIMKKCFFPLDTNMVSCPTCSKNRGRFLSSTISRIKNTIIRYLTYCRQANVGFCTGFFPFGKFLRGNSLIWNEFQPKYTFFFTKFQFTANISAHFAHQVNFPRFDHIYNFGGPVNKNKWLRYLTGSVMTNWVFFRISTDR